MTEERTLEVIKYTEIFSTQCELHKRLLVDSMELYALYGETSVREIPFDIVANLETKYIVPRCNPGEYDSFLLVAERLVDCQKIEIKADDYWHVTKNDDNYTFYMQEGYKNNDKNN